MFTPFAIRVLKDGSTGQRKLLTSVSNSEGEREPLFYYLQEGFRIAPNENSLCISSDRLETKPLYPLRDNPTDIDISLSAIVGENGSGKSTLTELMMRLINNLAAMTIGEQYTSATCEHLHYIAHVHAELFYLTDGTPFRLRVENRKVSLHHYTAGIQTEENREFVLEPTPDYLSDIEHTRQGVEHPIVRSAADTDRSILSNTFYTYISNYSLYAYNPKDYGTEEIDPIEYERQVRKLAQEAFGKQFAGGLSVSSTEQRHWLCGLFYKNDGYQTPVVLVPFRRAGNININSERELAKDKLLALILSSPEFRTLNGHLRITDIAWSERQDEDYGKQRLTDKQLFDNLSDKEYALIRESVLDSWKRHAYNGVTNFYNRNRAHGKAQDYLVYKTLKIAATYPVYYEHYENMRETLKTMRSLGLTEEEVRTHYEAELRKETNDFIDRLSKDHSHITSKIWRTLHAMRHNLYSSQGGEMPITELADQLAGILQADTPRKKAATNRLEDLLPPPYIKTRLLLQENRDHSMVELGTLSSGEKQQIYSISSLMYHLKNLDSVWDDGGQERLRYRHVNVVFEEVELYFHPEMQRTFISNLTNGLHQCRFKHLKSVHLCFVTHSPFLLSDIPSRNILALDQNARPIEQRQIKSFAANIHDMLRNPFFMQKPMGEEASRLINHILEQLRTKGEALTADERLALRTAIETLDEPVMRNMLQQEYRRTLPETERRLAEIEKQMKALQAERDKLCGN